MMVTSMTVPKVPRTDSSKSESGGMGQDWEDSTTINSRCKSKSDEILL